MKIINIKTFVILIIVSTFICSCDIVNTDDLPDGSKVSTVEDIDGNIYRTIKIGTQTWMVENLRVTKYRNGDQIATTVDPLQDFSLTPFPKYQWAFNGDESLAAKYGRLYTLGTVMDARNIAPVGWHIPTDEEWSILESYLVSSGQNYDGSKTGNKFAKSLAAKTDWIETNNIGSIGNDLTKNNSSGFSALPSGKLLTIILMNFMVWDIVVFGGLLLFHTVEHTIII